MASFVDGNKCVMALQVVQTTNLRQSSRFIIAPYVEEAMSTKSDVISAKKKKKKGHFTRPRQGRSNFETEN